MTVTAAPTLYLLTGISFAGKTVLAKRLAALMGIPRVDPDEVGRGLGLGLAGEFLTDEHWAIIHARAERNARDHLAAGRSVVYDTTAFTRAQRDGLRALASASGAAAVTIFVDTPRAVARERWCRNERTRERARIHADDFAMVADCFEPPQADEGALRYDPSDNPDAWIAAHIHSRRPAGGPAA